MAMVKVGSDYHEIQNKEFKTINTTNALNIIGGLTSSGIGYSGKYDDTKISLIYSAADSGKVAEIIEKADRKIQSENYSELLPEIADLLNTSVSALKNRPIDVQKVLTEIYVNNFYSDSITIKKALGQAIEINAITEEDIRKAEDLSENSNNTPQKQGSVNEQEKVLEYAAEIEREAYRQQRENVANEEKRTHFFTRDMLKRETQRIRQQNSSSIEQNRETQENYDGINREK